MRESRYTELRKEVDSIKESFEEFRKSMEVRQAQSMEELKTFLGSWMSEYRPTTSENRPQNPRGSPNLEERHMEASDTLVTRKCQIESPKFDGSELRD